MPSAFAELHAFSGHRGGVNVLSSPGDERLATGGEDGSVRLWDLAAGRAVRAILVPGAADDGVTAVHLGAVGEAANWVFAATGAAVFGYDLRAPGLLLREPTRRFASNTDEVVHLTVLNGAGFGGGGPGSGLVLAAADDAGEVHMLDVGTGGPASAPLRGAHQSLCSASAFRPGFAHELYTAGLDCNCVRWDWRRALAVETWNLSAPTTTTQLLNPRHVHDLSFTADGLGLALALGDGSIEVRTASGGTPVAAVEAHRAATSQVQFAPTLRPLCNELCDELAADAQPLLSAGDDRMLRLWSVEGVTPLCSPAPGDDGPSKRRRGGFDGGNGGDDDGGDDGEAGAEEQGEEMEHGAAGEPGFRALLACELPEKPNGITAATSGTGGVVCVASPESLVRVLRVTV
jgi:WD40 repeat protein